MPLALTTAPKADCGDPAPRRFGEQSRRPDIDATGGRSRVIRLSSPGW